MKVSELIGLDMVHTTAPHIKGKITDVLFPFSLQDAVFFLADITTSDAMAPVLFSPTVLALEDDTFKIGAHPDDVIARVDASTQRTEVALDPADVPSTFIGPFGNTFSPSLIAALFNARTGNPNPERPKEAEGVWFSELQGSGVRAHVAPVGVVKDINLDAHCMRCETIQIEMADGAERLLPPAAFHTTRGPDGAALLALVQPDEVA